MPIKRSIPYNEGVYFITFTCYNWLPLIDMVKGYDLVYKCPSDRPSGRGLTI
jgi:hypothetical protein